MSDLIIRIGDDALDLSVDQTIAITKQAAKVGDFSTVLADGTNEVTVPLTPNNRQIMDNAHMMQSDSPRPYGRLDATLIQEGYETIQDGYALLTASADNFSIQLVGGNATFFDLIKDAELRDLPLSEYEHFWTNQEVFDRRNETEGLIYAVFEQSLDDETMHTYGVNLYAVETKLLLPSFYVKTLVEKLFEAQGYTFITDLTGEDIYEKAVVFRGAIPNRGIDMSYHECTVTSDFLDVANTVLFDSAVVTGTSPYVSNTQFQAGVQTPNKRFTLTDSCTVTLDVHLDIFYTGLFPYANTLYVKVLATNQDGGQYFYTGQIDINIGVVGDPNDSYDFTLTFPVTSLPLGSTYFQVSTVCASAAGFFFDAGSSYTVRDIVLIENTVVTTSFPNSYITGALPVPDMKQGEFMKELARIYQWVFDTDERTHTVTARRFDNVKEQTINAIDLSDKLHAKGIKITYGIDGFAQTNALRYKPDDVSKYDAVGYINVADTTLNPTRDYVKMSQFAASSTRLRFDTVNAPFVPMFEEQLPTNGMTDRIFLVRRVDPFPYNVNFARVGSTPANHPTDDLTFAYFAEAGNDDSLDFPTLIDRFYQTIIDMNDKGKSVEANMNLNIRDVVNYDPLTPVYISHFGNYFYWEKLSNYVKGKLTKCKFIRI